MEIENDYIVYSKKSKSTSIKITELTIEYVRKDYAKGENGIRYRVPTRHTAIREVNSASHNRRTLNFLIDNSFILLFTYLISIAVDVTFKYFVHSFDQKFVFILLLPIVYFVYYIFLEFKYQKTIGKFLTKTILIDEYAESPSLQQVFWRTFKRIPRYNYINFYWSEYMNRSNYCRGIHDRNTHTWVVPFEEYIFLKKALVEPS